MDNRPNKLVIVGAGGLGLEALWAARAMDGWQVLGFADDDAAKVGTIHGGEPVVGLAGEIARRLGIDVGFLLAVGDNRLRRDLAAALGAQGLKPASIVHPTARLGPGVVLGQGCYLAPGVTLAPYSVLGDHVIVNTNAVIGHESRVGSFSQVCPGAVVSGQCRLGEGCYVGSNAALQPGVQVADWGRVAACSFATVHVEAGQTVLGNPARPVFRQK